MLHKHGLHKTNIYFHGLESSQLSSRWNFLKTVSLFLFRIWVVSIYKFECTESIGVTGLFNLHIQGMFTKFIL